MKLNFTRKTWYFLLLAAAGASMANGFAVLSGMDFSFLEMCSFCATEMAVLFLAADKATAEAQKKSYFGVFLILLLSYIFGGGLGYLCSALGWPLLLATEQRRGVPVQRQFRLVCITEAAHLALVFLATFGGFVSLRFTTNLFWLILGIVRGWGALSLYRWQKDD